MMKKTFLFSQTFPLIWNIPHRLDTINNVMHVTFYLIMRENQIHMTQIIIMQVLITVCLIITHKMGCIMK